MRVPAPKRLAWWAAAALAAVLSLAACSSTPEDGDGLPAATVDAGVDYTVNINVPSENGLKADVLASSRLISLQKSPPPSLPALQRRAADDAARFDEVMRSRGYFDSDISYAVNGDAPPYDVEISIAPGEVFVLAAFDIAYVGGPPENEPARATLADLKVELGSPAAAQTVIDAEGRLQRWLKDRGYPYARITDRLSLANFPDKSVWVQVTVETGPLIRFGELQISGLERTDPDLVTRSVDWKPGDIYDQRLVDQMRARLNGTGVFSTITVAPEGGADGGTGERVMKVEVAEGPPRSISAGLGYQSDLGPEVRLGWEHRNLFGEAELLSLRTTVGTLSQRLDGTLRKPDFLRRDQDLVIASSLLNEDFDAYARTGIESSAIIERPLSEHTTGSVGVATDFFKISDDIGPERSLLFGLPVTFDFDNSNSLLNPIKGFRFSLTTTPWAGNADTPVEFLSTDINGSAYQALDPDSRIVAAVRGQFGTNWGAQLKDIPANRRFYAGGGGSIRGYEFQRVGPLDDQNNPIGGNSVMVVGTELRVMVTEEIGIVPFIEGGTVYKDTRPDFSAPLFWGAGLGLRYLTAVGPIRFDLAVPLDRRDNIDDPYQFYISLGQAF